MPLEASFSGQAIAHFTVSTVGQMKQVVLQLVGQQQQTQAQEQEQVCPTFECGCVRETVEMAG